MARGDSAGKQQCIDIILKFYSQTGSTSSKEFKQWRRYVSPCYNTIRRKFGGRWSDVIRAAGLSNK